jgi:hypothetical protein
MLTCLAYNMKDLKYRWVIYMTMLAHQGDKLTFASYAQTC